MASWELADEVIDVLRRPKLARYGLTEQDVADVLAVLSPLLPRIEVDVPIRDRNDAPVVAAALAGAAETIVTGDADLLADDAVRVWLGRHQIEVLNAVEVLDRIKP